MSKKTLLVLLFLLLVALVVSGCTPACDASTLPVPTLGNPGLWEILDPSAVVLNWDLTCEPDQFEIILSQERDFSVLEITELVNGDQSSWSPPILDSAEEYFWRVAAIEGSTQSPYSYQIKSFFTEPVCGSGDLVMPSLLLPVSGGIYTRGYDSLEWEWPISSCIPESYRVEVSPDPGFVDQTRFGATGNPSTRWGPSPEFDAATQYWWRIIPYADENPGPPSLTGHFFTDPICSGASLVTPSPIFPPDWDTVTTDIPEFSWSYPDTSCSPEGFHLRVSITEDMSSIILEANNPTHGATSFQAGVPFDDCQTYYWQVAVVSESIESGYSHPYMFNVDMTDSCTCDPSNLPIPDLIWPEPVWTGNYDIVSLNPTLEWSNPGPCTPDGYQVKLSDLPDYADPSLNGDVLDGAITTYTPPIQLLPARQYWWHVFSTYQGALSNNSNYAAFFTEPECELVADLLAPEIIWPVDGEVIDTLEPMFSYEQSLAGCIPDTYLINIQTDMNFAGNNLLGEIAFPSTGVGVATPLADCTMYYLKVAGVQDGAPGPYSDVVRFFTDEQGSCIPAPAIANKNTFCRIGTFADVAIWKEAVHLFLEGDYVPVLAKNPFETYYKSYALMEDGVTPQKPLRPCWLIAANVILGDPKYPKELPIESPPPTPVPTPTPVPRPVCHAKLGAEECKKAGGTYDTGKKFCYCP